MREFYKSPLLIPLLLILIFLSSGGAQSITQVLGQAEQKILYYKIMKNCKDYNSIENNLSKIYYTEQDTEYINLIKATIDLYYPLLASDFDMEPTKAVFVIYPDQASMDRCINTSSSTLPMGAYYGGVINILSPQLLSPISSDEHLNKNLLLEKGPIIHELTHFLLDKKTKGNYDLWFSEGLALYYEYKYTAFEWRGDLKEKSREISLTELKNNFRSLDEALAYRRAFDIINNICISNGESYLQYIVLILSLGDTILVGL